MSTVYVVQNQHRWDKEKQQLVPAFDLSSARQFGEMEYLLSPKASPWRPAVVIPEIRRGLKNVKPEDYLLLIGNPCLIGWTVAIAAELTGGAIRLLQWNGRDGKYIPIECDLMMEQRNG